MTLEPDTRLSSGTLATQKSPELDRAFWRNELQDGDVHKLSVVDSSRTFTASAT